MACEQIVVFEVNKSSSCHEYSHQAKLCRFGLSVLYMASIFDFQISISLLFEKLRASNLEFNIITPKSITWTNFYTNIIRFGLTAVSIVAILVF